MFFNTRNVLSTIIILIGLEFKSVLRIRRVNLWVQNYVEYYKIKKKKDILVNKQLTGRWNYIVFLKVDIFDRLS